MSSLIIVDSEQELERALRENRELFVLFYSSWCLFSEIFLPVFEESARRMEGDFCSVDVEFMEQCRQKYSIKVTPTVLFFRDGKVARRLDGEPGVGLDDAQLAALVRAETKKTPAGGKR